MIPTLSAGATLAALFAGAQPPHEAPPGPSPSPWIGDAPPAWLGDPLPALQSAHAESERGGWYLQLGAGLVTTEESDGPDEEIDFDEGYAIPVAIGHRFGADDGNAFAFDVELEGIWTDQDADDDGPIEAVTDVSQLGVLLNGVADLGLTETLSFYGGAGIGPSYVDVGTESDALNDFDEDEGPYLAWQAKAGLRWWAGRSVSWSLGYRFLNIDDTEIDDDVGSENFDLETQQHVLELGIRFQL